MRARSRLVHAAAQALLCAGLSGCMVLSPQLDPPDIAALEQVEDRGERERLYTDNSIYRHVLPQGVRYTRGNHPLSVKRTWQSLDAILRSDMNASEALPVRTLRASRILTALTAISALAVVSGAAASAREGLDLKSVGGTGVLLLAGGVATVGFGIGAGVTYNRARKGYDRAVDIYNESLGLRLGVLDANGEYKPPPGVLVDSEGYILLGDEAGPLPPVSSTRVPPRPTDGDAPVEALPQRLDADAIRVALAEPQSRAFAECRAHAQGGEEVAVTLTVAGASGEVVAAESAATPLAECAAAILQGARFPTFASPSQVVQVKMRF